MPGGQAEDLEVDEHEATPSPAHRHQKGREMAAVDLRVLRDEAGEGGAAEEGEEEGEEAA